ncbi:sedoheptulose 7-phosphate cyclase [Streptomyces cyaneochromogenes]|uniref:2-epi-5-epi-valiolone synthase n=1 Tax=Streptomyces cyaneochromogenes TaxID=2496836 RepID=A0A3S9LZQ1_9ACTN|nr:sedoheptulose 7-phosphate cyclase [Streptomyces cyaneochromogenes]AZQ32389.1 sedoheptulose 7-phosphate cyclase [Streptomyces cyaneochromogenes]
MTSTNLTETPLGLHFSEGSQGWLVRAEKQISYEVRFRDGIFRPEFTDLLEKAGGNEGTLRCFVIVDSNVDILHGDQIRAYFEHHRVDCSIMVVEANETVKDFETAARIVSEIDAFGIARRKDPLIVIGGGVLMDIVGLVASLYRRGAPFLRVPTTLIGLVDAGVGVKTGVNFNGHKNRLGTYASADLTLLDRRFLSTLDRRHIGNGLAEILKIALIKDATLFELLEEHGPTVLDEKFQGVTAAGEQAAQSVLHAAIQGMLEELQPNLWEAQLERCVDYGHTFSPTLEMRALPELLHGEAVCVDMALTTVMAFLRGQLTERQRDRIFAVMSALELPSWHPILDPDTLAHALQDTMRHRDGQQRLPLPVGIGGVTFVNDVTPQELEAACALLERLGDARVPEHGRRRDGESRQTSGASAA